MRPPAAGLWPSPSGDLGLAAQRGRSGGMVPPAVSGTVARRAGLVALHCSPVRPDRRRAHRTQRTAQAALGWCVRSAQPHRPAGAFGLTAPDCGLRSRPLLRSLCGAVPALTTLLVSFGGCSGCRRAPEPSATVRGGRRMPRVGDGHGTGSAGRPCGSERMRLSESAGAVPFSHRSSCRGAAALAAALGAGRLRLPPRAACRPRRPADRRVSGPRAAARSGADGGG